MMIIVIIVVNMIPVTTASICWYGKLYMPSDVLVQPRLDVDLQSLGLELFLVIQLLRSPRIHELCAKLKIPSSHCRIPFPGHWTFLPIPENI